MSTELRRRNSSFSRNAKLKLQCRNYFGCTGVSSSIRNRAGRLIPGFTPIKGTRASYCKVTITYIKSGQSASSSLLLFRVDFQKAVPHSEHTVIQKWQLLTTGVHRHCEITAASK
jgi:hypothetical protein